jgi:ubiquinone/menaquinone biosynthesis C-methylase UbiE
MITIDFNRLDIHPNNRILDIGCGEGRHTIRAAQEPSTICTGADFGFDNLVQTRDKLAFHDQINDLSCRDWHLSAMDITALPFADNSFDLVICSEVLEHIPDDATAMSELVRIVRPGKTLAVSVPRAWPEKICWQLSDEYFNANMGHVRIYQKKALIQSIETLGPKFTGSHFAHSIHAPYWWLKCLVGPNRTDSAFVNLYHRLLVWDLMKKPKITTFVDKLFNPILGKSLVLYFKKPLES